MATHIAPADGSEHTMSPDCPCGPTVDEHGHVLHGGAACDEGPADA